MRTPRHLFDSLVTVQRRVKGGTVKGEYTYTWPAIGEVEVRIRTKNAQERAVGDALHYAWDHRVYLPPETDIKSGDRIVFGSRTFEVLGVWDVDEADVFLTADVAESTEYP